MAYESQTMRDARIDVGAVIGAVVRRLPRIILVTLLLLAATFVFLMFQPRLYESSASILVEPRNNAYTRPANEQAPQLSGSEAGVVSSQIELIKSRDTLLNVIDQLNLRSVPEFNGSGSSSFNPLAVVTQLLGRGQSVPASIDETVLNNLYARLTVVQERDSRIISVLVRSTDPQRAADIANAVANAHVVRRAGLALSDTAEASTWLSEEITRLRVKVQEAETAVANFKVENDLFTGANNTSLLDQNLSTIATQIAAAQERKNTAQSRAALIRGMIDRGQSIEGVADVRDSAVIQRLSEEKARLQGERAQSSATLLPNHPTIRAMTAQIAELNNQIAIEGRRVADALDAEAQIEADLEASLRGDLNRAKSSASTATQDTVTLDGLQREAKAQRDLLEGYLQRYNEAFSRTEVNLALPDVRVVSEAAPSVTPASPRTQLILMAVGIVSLLLQIGLVVFSELMSGRALVEVRPAPRAQDELDEMPFVASELEPDQKWEEPEEYVDAVEAPAVAVYEAPPVERVVHPVVAEPVDEVRAYVHAVNAEVGTVTYAEKPVIEDAPLPVEQPAVVIQPRPEPVAPAAPAAAPARDLATLSFNDLADDLKPGHTQVLFLAAHSSNRDVAELAEDLIGEALSRGLSVALVDAGSGHTTDELGLADLSRDLASFGDVVQKSADNSFAEVPWGQSRAISRQSQKPYTLVEALSDIYEVVILMTGRVGMTSTLPMFSGLEGRLILVAGEGSDLEAVDHSRDELREAGFGSVEIAALAPRVAA